MAPQRKAPSRCVTRARWSHVLLVVAPEPEDLHHSLVLEHLVDQAMLDIDTARIGPGEVTDKLLERGWLAVGVFSQEVQQFLGLRLEAAGSQFPGVFLCLPGEDQPPCHQSSSSSHSSTGVSMPSRIDSRIPGTESR